MKITQLLIRYNITENDLHTLVTGMLEGKSLCETSVMVKNKLTPEQVFAVAKFYCFEEFGLPVDEMAPHFCLQRIDMQIPKLDNIIAQIEFNKEVKKLKGIEEDLRFLELEIKAKAA
jgi:hypothetical protein